MSGIVRLLYPKMTQVKNRLKFRSERAGVKAFLLACIGLIFWGGVFLIFYRVLSYFNSIDVIGNFLAAKLLSMVLLTFFSVLLFSNIITAISTFFMSEELQLIIASPFELYELYYAKLFETIMNSSWMVVLFSLPVFLSYGVVFDQSVTFYVMLVGSLAPFLIICGSIGSGIAICLVSVFPARRIKDVLFLLSIFLVIGMYLLFRLIKPERFVDPDNFLTVVDYLSALETPTSVFLPSQWATDVLASFLFNSASPDAGFKLLLLWSTALALVVILSWIFSALFVDSWSKSQEAKTVRVSRHRFFTRLLEWILKPLSTPARAVVDKDIRIFFRDTSQWSQLFILSAIIVIYLYNFSVLPMDKSPIPTRQLQNLISFLNLGLAGFVIAAVAVRFGYPAVSLEGESFWIVRSSPFGLKGLLWCKFWVNFIFLFVLAEVLAVFSNYFLRVETFMMVLSIVTVFLMTFGLSSLSIGFGAMYPRFKYENVAQIPTGYGGLMYMIISVLFICMIVVCEAWPVRIVLMARFYGKELTPSQILQIVTACVLLFSLSAAAFIIPMRMGLKSLAAREEF
ncbi:hypothetical protein ACFL43_01180 [Thermodesulfobacteriota bacterium]